MDRLTSMAVFVRSVELGSFAAAANAMEISAPMVGKHVRSLETRLGVRLINRTTRSHTLTEAGRAYFERCRAVLAEAEAADAVAMAGEAEPRGRLRVAMPVHLGRHLVVPVLLALVQEHPGLQLDLSLDDRLVDLSEDGFDLAIRTGRLDARSGIMARLLYRQDMVVCASPSYLHRYGSPPDIGEIAAHRGVVYRRSGRVRPWLFPDGRGGTAEVLPSHTVRLDDLDAIADAAVAGLGLAWLPRWLVETRLDEGALEPVLTHRLRFNYDCHAVWLRTPYLPARVRLAINALAQAFDARDRRPVLRG